MPNRRTRVTFPVFNGYEVRVIFTRDIKATGRRLDVDLSKYEAAWVTHPEEPYHGWMVLKLDASAGTIAHEASHAIRSMFNYVGARMDNESFAHHLDYLVGRIHKFLKR